jgi:hypothetical protein
MPGSPTATRAEGAFATTEDCCPGADHSGAIVFIYPGHVEFVSQAKIQSQLAINFEIVLREPGIIGSAQPCVVLALQSERNRPPDQKVGHGVPCESTVEIEGAGALKLSSRLLSVLHCEESKFQRMPATNPGKLFV